MSDKQYAPNAMSVNPRNAQNKPLDADGKREWSEGLFDAFGDPGTCLLAACVPCVVYGRNKSRLAHLANTGKAHPTGGDVFGGSCFLFGCIALCTGFSFLLQCAERGNVRERYGIAGGCCGDCCAAAFCHGCALTQESHEIELEEQAVGGR